MKQITYRKALHDGLEEVLDNFPLSFLMGEDVGRYGGAYAISKDFLSKFGEDRIRDTPLSESVFTGAGIGAAMGGLRPIVEIMTCNFALLALDQIINNAATLHHMSGGQIQIPLILRLTTGAGRQLAAQHSHSWEGWLSHIPGLKIITPATITDARYMLKAAMDDACPILFFEQAALYNMTGNIDHNRGVDLQKAQILREGKDITLITYGASLSKCLQASEELKKDNIDCEVIDLRVLRPLDNETLFQSITKTHKVIIVDEGWKSGGLSAEIAARIGENLFYELDKPIKRICSEEVPMPYAKPLEDAILPSVEKIIQTTRSLCHESP